MSLCRLLSSFAVSTSTLKVLIDLDLRVEQCNATLNILKVLITNYEYCTSSGTVSTVPGPGPGIVLYTVLYTVQYSTVPLYSTVQ